MTDTSPPLPLWLTGRPAKGATSATVWLPPPVQHHHDGPCSCEATLAYIRVSKVGKRQIIISPDIQFSAIVEDCRIKGKRIVGVVTDIDKSGRTFIKRSVDGAIRDLANGVAKSITVWKWSRWGRNLEYSLAYLGRVQKVGGRVDSATDDIEQITATGRFSRDMVMRVDQLNSELIGEGWQATHSQRRDDGLPHAGRQRFGYLYIPARGRDEPARYEPLEPGATALKTAYERYVAGAESLRGLSRWLNDQGFYTTLGGPWTPEAVGFMLDTGFAAGWIRERSDERLAQDRAKQEDGKYVRNGLSTFDMWRRGSHAPVIGEDLWEAYKAKRLAQADLPAKLRGVAPHALSALMFCELCSRRLCSAYTGAKRVHTWRCPGKDTFHRDVPVTITNERAMEIVRAWVDRMAKAPVLDVDELARRVLANDGKSIRTAAQIQTDIRAELRALDNLLDMAARKVISEDRYTLKAAEYEERVSELREELGGLADVPGQRDYRAFVELGRTWDAAAEHEPALLNAPLRGVLAFVVVSPAEGRGRWHDAADRVDVVGRWEEDRRASWLEARRRRSFAA